MRNTCRFPDCKTWGKINAVYVNLQDGGVFELEWCTICGRIQSKIK